MAKNGTTGEREWTAPLVWFVVGLLVFETVSGLSIWLLPFSVSNQFLVLTHTGGGLLFTLPALIYQFSHWQRLRSSRIDHVALSGYLVTAALAVATVSGFVLTWQAVFGTRIGGVWDSVHIASTIAIIAAMAGHMVPLVLRAARAASQGHGSMLSGVRSLTAHTGILTVAGLVLTIGAALLYNEPDPEGELPEDYGFLYGEDRPFAPSLARTATNRPFDAGVLSGSAGCGYAGCHSEIADEWSVSAHRWSAMDPAFQKVQGVMAEQNGPESTRYCGGCHDPISLFAGAKNLFSDSLSHTVGYDEGVSCLACHAISETDVKGNADYVVAAPPRYAFELSRSASAQSVSRFLIRAYPQQHIEKLQRTLFKTPEFCAACHKQFIDEEINQVGWVQLQNQYDNWRKSRWNHPGDPTRTIECRECHMPLVSSLDPASGDGADYNRSPDDGQHRSHRFLGANQFVPAHLQLPGADEQVRLTESWLRGDFEIPEIADKWQDGPAVPIELVVPESFEAGQEASVSVVVTNNKLGHDFPTGPLDIIQAWVELTVTDDDGTQVYQSGGLDEDLFVQPGSFLFKAEPVDRYGNLIDRHNLWEMVGVRYRRSLYPGFTDQNRFVFQCPSFSVQTGDPLPEQSEFQLPAAPSGRLHIKARLLYRKMDQFMLDTFFPGKGLTSPITVMSEASATVEVR
jgi:cytochrome c554/c'-like protein